MKILMRLLIAMKLLILCDHLLETMPFSGYSGKASESASQQVGVFMGSS